MLLRSLEKISGALLLLFAFFINAHGQQGMNSMDFNGKTNFKRPRLLVIGGKESSLEGLSRLDIDIVLFQSAEEVNDFQRKISAEIHILELDNVEDVQKRAFSIHSRGAIQGVVAFAEQHLLTAALIVDRLKIPGNPLRPVELTRDKAKMREALRNSDFPVVRHKVCYSLDEIRSFFKSISGPCIIKPTSGSGSRGVALVTKEDEIEGAYNRCISTHEGYVLVEEFIDGPEFSIESISTPSAIGPKHEILAITQKTTTNAPHFIELAHLMPAPLEEEKSQTIRRTVLQFLDLIGQQVGPCHTEIRLGRDNRAYIIESQTRFGGDQIWEMIELTTGINLASRTAASLLNVPDVVRNPQCKAAAIRFFLEENVHVLEVGGKEDAEKVEGTVRAKLDLAPGSTFYTALGSNSRQGYILVVGDSVIQAKNRVDEAFSKVVLKVDSI